MKYFLILIFLLTSCRQYDQPTVLYEGIQTIKQEGIINFTIQLTNYIGSKLSLDEDKAVAVKEEVMYKSKSIKLLSDTIPNPGVYGMYYLPIYLDLTNTNSLGYRNRGDDMDIHGSALISVFTPFMTPSELFGTKYGKLPSANFDSYVFAINKKGSFKVGKLIDFAGTDYKVSQTWPPKKIVSINLDGINSNLSWSNAKAIKLVHLDNKETCFPIGLGPSGTGNDIGGYSGGKILISTPEGLYLTFIYGTANQLKFELNNYILKHELSYVLFYDLDLKSYAQTLNSYDGVLTKEYLKSRDNLNSAQSGAGSFVYLKN